MGPTDLRPYGDPDHEPSATLLGAHGWAEQYVAGQLDAVAMLAASKNGAQGFSEDYRMSRYYSDALDGVTYLKFFT